MAKTIDPRHARAAAWDAANRQAAKHHRKAWNEDDWNLACSTLARLTEPARAARD